MRGLLDPLPQPHTARDTAGRGRDLELGDPAEPPTPAAWPCMWNLRPNAATNALLSDLRPPLLPPLMLITRVRGFVLLL